MMITYEQVKLAMTNPPTPDLIDLFNWLGTVLSDHPDCVNDENPFDKLYSLGKFCISATSIQPDYIAFVLGKHIRSVFPPEVIQQFFNIDPEYRLQYGNIKGKEIDGCICLIHKGHHNYNLKTAYEQIYT